ncbi:MAG: Lrp/AsnC ligand binding domain-containing protein [Nitrosopumilus sp.]|uniref:Lrp/AsnC ligand binding domain-containing protein n=1 Tax=Nitrosopumilus TaxID=338191 RepID=UPI000D6FE4BC|nr:MULTISPECIES: Lrp/AsnC ligand binding domain-containing protein [Nitrosopumilus]MCV0367434.1 Lrp/AsnC ligand binding domain-containing protein [Nitrosopumilus sp.]BDQ31047.1 Lrp/AsnC ligand binding domain-containing protein [Nitrosopumilus zosterae]
METALVLVKSEISHEMDVMRQLLKIDQVKEAKGTFGLYDIFVKIEANSSLEIADIITKQIRKITHVISTTTLSVIPEQNKK